MLYAMDSAQICLIFIFLDHYTFFFYNNFNFMGFTM